MIVNVNVIGVRNIKETGRKHGTASRSSYAI